jgi:predicted dehydrogenase
MSARVMRVGVIGLGTIGETHVAALRQLGVTQIYGADPSASARSRFAEHTRQCFADYRGMLSSVELDAVVIATPPRTHREIAVAAVDAGPGVLCEKPLALTLEDCNAIVDAAARGSRPFWVGFCHRFQPQVRALHGVLESGALGQLALVNVSFVQALTEQNREWITDPKHAGGGVLFDSGSHVIDLFRYLAGDIDEVHGLTAVLDASARVEDTIVGCLRSGSVLGSIALCWRTQPWQGLVEIIGTNGRARVDYDDSDRVRLRTRIGDDPWRVVRTQRENRYVAQMRDFLACLRGRPASGATARDGLEATRTVLRIYAEQ